MLLSNKTRATLGAVLFAMGFGGVTTASAGNATPAPAPTVTATVDDTAKAQALQTKATQYQQEANKDRQIAAGYAASVVIETTPGAVSGDTTSSTPAVG